MAGSNGRRSTTKHDPTALEFEPLDDRIVRKVRAMMREHHVPGVAVGIWHDGRAMAGGFGVTNLNAPADVTEHVLFPLGSVTKTYTGTLAMQLVDAGLLDLHAPISSYLPDLKLRSKKALAEVTVQQALTHRAGWHGDELEDTGMGDDALERFVAHMRTVPQLTPPGSVAAYNNAAFMLVGAAIERVTSERFEAVMRDRLLDPLGMHETVFSANDAIRLGATVGHTRVDGKTVVEPRTWTHGRGVHPAGGLASSVIDQLRWARLHLGGGPKRIVKATTLRSMQKVQHDEAPFMANSRMGLAWMRVAVDGHRVLQHGGTIQGQTAAMTLAPDDRFAIVVMANASSGHSIDLPLSRWALADYAGIDASRPPPEHRTPTQLREYAGRYTHPRFDVTATVEARKGGFRTRAEVPEGDPPRPWVQCVFDGPDSFRDVDDEDGFCGDFVRTRAGKIRWLRVGGRLYRRE